MSGDLMLMSEVCGLPIAREEGRGREVAQGSDSHDGGGSGQEPTASQF